ncbi:MAG TPA: GDP-mannose 4,6-dehydratase [Vicinamibacterales bacterium]|nr:GDP-mannose 4,6-dehydratase [Vicinamibacterales bacterium]
MSGVRLVTGGTGFAGSHLVERLVACGHAVEAWSNPSGHPPSSLHPSVSWRAVDLLDREALASAVATLSPVAIYHCAGFADVAGASVHRDRALRVNAIGTHHLLEAVRRSSASCPVLVTGSALVYRPSADALREDSPIEPWNPYGFTKLAQEMIAMSARATPVYLARPFNHAGPRQSPAYVTSSFARQIAEIETGRREPVLLAGNLDSRRDIMDVRDTVRAYQLIVDRGRPGRAYNVCSGRSHRIGDLLEMLVGMARIEVDVRRDPERMRPADIPVVLGDPSRLVAETGWRPEIPIEQTLADLLDYWRGRLAAPRA